MRGGIVIDPWKLDIFTRHLKQSGYVFESKPGPAAGMLTLFIETDNLEALGVVVKAANTEAAQTKPGLTNL